MKTGLILFAHGARDPRWAHPFQRLQAMVQSARPGVPVVLAFLELMRPDLNAAALALADQGCQEIRVVPIFLGQGGHVREDLPALVAAARKQHPGIGFVLQDAVGEDEHVLRGIAARCVQGIAGSDTPA